MRDPGSRIFAVAAVSQSHLFYSLQASQASVDELRDASAAGSVIDIFDQRLFSHQRYLPVVKVQRPDLVSISGRGPMVEVMTNAENHRHTIRTSMDFGEDSVGEYVAERLATTAWSVALVPRSDVEGRTIWSLPTADRGAAGTSDGRTGGGRDMGLRDLG